MTHRAESVSLDAMSKGHLRRAEYMVRDVTLTVAKRLVEADHYARGGANTGVHFHSIFRRDDPFVPLGVAWWMPPTKGAARATFPEGEWRKVLALTRFVLVPDLPTNAASFLLSRSIKAIRKEGRWDCLVTYADESQGHVGTIYRATNWEYMGLTKPQPRWIDPATGRQVARKATHTRTNAEMLELGYERDGNYAKHKFRMALRRPAVALELAA